MAELVTLQFGGAANWVGAHLWNINSDAAARSSVIFTARQHSCPRLVSFDLASSVGATSRGREIDPAADSAGVPQDVVRIERQAHEVDPSNPSLWTDFITTPLMSDSVVRLGNLDWNDSNPNEFNNFTFGRRLMAGQNDRETFTEPLRKQVEDCDELQGFPVLLDHTQPAFAGFVADYLVHLQDEYPRTPVLLFSVGVEAGLPAAALHQRERHILNECLAIQSLHAADIFVPLPLAPSAAHFPGLPHYQQGNRLHASGLLALGIDTALSPLWIANSPRPLSSVLVQLSAVGPARRLAALSLALPHTASHKPSLLCPMLPANGVYVADSALCVARGVASVPPPTALRLSLSLPPLPKSTIMERLLCPSTPSAADGAVTAPFAVPPALAIIEKTNSFHARLAELCAEFARIDRHRAVQCLGDEITVDDVRETQAALSNITELYATD